jgi:hypothetical protein
VSGLVASSCAAGTLILVVAVLVLGGLQLALRRTAFGREMRGTLGGGIVLGIAQTVGASIDPQCSILAGHLAFLVILVSPRGRSIINRGAHA